MIVLETDRLTLEEFTLKDAPFILELVNTDSWLAYIGDKNIRTVEEASNYIENSLLQAYNKNGFGHWKVREQRK
jgi:RimJ/RimL family protein N-acetyltransferase